MTNTFDESTNVSIGNTNVEGQGLFVELVANRVRKRAQALGLNASSLGKKLEIPTSTASNYWTGKRAWPLELMPFLTDALDTNLEKLTSLEGVMTRGLPALRASTSGDLVKIREIDLTFGMGSTYLDVPVTEEMHRFPKAWVRRFTRADPEHLFFAHGVGDSMEPTLYDSDLLLIDSSQRQLVMADKIWAISYADCGMIKRLRPVPGGGVEIWSDNKAVSPITAYDGEMEIIGRVVATERKL